MFARRNNSEAPVDVDHVLVEKIVALRFELVLQAEAGPFALHVAEENKVIEEVGVGETDHLGPYVLSIRALFKATHHPRRNRLCLD